MPKRKHKQLDLNAPKRELSQIDMARILNAMLDRALSRKDILKIFERDLESGQIHESMIDPALDYLCERGAIRRGYDGYKFIYNNFGKAENGLNQDHDQDSV